MGEESFAVRNGLARSHGHEAADLVARLVFWDARLLVLRAVDRRYPEPSLSISADFGAAPAQNGNHSAVIRSTEHAGRLNASLPSSPCTRKECGVTCSGSSKRL